MSLRISGSVDEVCKEVYGHMRDYNFKTEFDAGDEQPEDVSMTDDES